MVLYPSNAMADAVPPADVHAVLPVLPDAVPDTALQPDAALPVPDAASAVAAVAEEQNTTQPSVALPIEWRSRRPMLWCHRALLEGGGGSGRLA